MRPTGRLARPCSSFSLLCRSAARWVAGSRAVCIRCGGWQVLRATAAGGRRQRQKASAAEGLQVQCAQADKQTTAGECKAGYESLRPLLPQPHMLWVPMCSARLQDDSSSCHTLQLVWPMR